MAPATDLGGGSRLVLWDDEVVGRPGTGQHERRACGGALHGLSSRRRLEPCARRSRDEECRFDQWRIRTGLRRAVATANVTCQSPQGRDGGNGGLLRTLARG